MTTPARAVPPVPPRFGVVGGGGVHDVGPLRGGALPPEAALPLVHRRALLPAAGVPRHHADHAGDGGAVDTAGARLENTHFQ